MPTKPLRLIALSGSNSSRGAADTGDESAEALCSVLIHKVSEYGCARPDGTMEYGPVDVIESLQTFEHALQLINLARGVAGAESKNQELSPDQMKEALRWLVCKFEDSFLENDELKQKIQMMDSHTSKMIKKEKKAVRDQRRDAFKSWKWRWFGNVHLFHAMLQYGIYDLKSIQDFMMAYLEEKCYSGDAHLAGSVITPEYKQTLRAEAVKARQLLKKARKLAASSKVVTAAETLWFGNWHQGNWSTWFWRRTVFTGMEQELRR